MEAWTEYFTKCLPCVTARITRNHRVSPETSVGGGRVITKSNLEDSNVQSTRFSNELNGEINLHYVSEGSDEEGHVVIECPTIFEFSSTGNAVENVDAQRKLQNNSSVGQKPSNENNNCYLTTVFIETSKRKQLRVIHLRAIVQKDEDEDEMIPYENNVQDDSLKMNNSSSSSDDEDEYWFSKWSRRPRLKKFVDVQRKSSNITIPLPPVENISIPIHTDSNISVSSENEALQINQQEWNTCLNPSDADKLDNQDFIDGNSPKKQVTSGSSPSPPESPTTFTSEVERCRKNSLENGFTNLAFQPDEDDNIETAVNIHTNLKDCQDTDTTHNTAMDINKVTQQGMEETFEKTQETSSSVPPPDDTDDLSSLKPLLFFIHGISGSSETFSSQIDYFHKLGYEIVALDLLGHGLSSTPPQAKLYHFESLVQDVVTVFDHFVLDERQVVIIGHGYGACLATVLTRIRPKNARILISISGGGPTPMVASYWCQTSWLSFPCNFLPRRKKQGRFDNPDLRHILPYNIHENILSGQIWLDGDPAFHRRIAIPTLLVYGMRDKVVNLVEVCEMERTIPRAFLEIINTAGHMVMWDESKKLNRMMRKFIESQWS